MELSINRSTFNYKMNYRQNVNFGVQYTKAVVFQGLYKSPNNSILKSKEEIKRILELAQLEINNTKDIDKKTGTIYYMTIDCFIGMPGMSAYWNSLWCAIHKSTPNALLILKEILLADESRNKTADDLLKEMIDKLNSNKEQNYKSTQSSQAQQKSDIHTKKGWTERQFIEHILKVVIGTRFRPADLKPAEIRNLAKMFGIEEEQVTNMDRKTYCTLAKRYHPDADRTAQNDKFVILNSLYKCKS